MHNLKAVIENKADVKVSKNELLHSLMHADYLPVVIFSMLMSYFKQ